MDRVSKELGMFLKQKGFDKKTIAYRWDPEGVSLPANFEALHYTPSLSSNHNKIQSKVSAPSHFEVLEWLKEKYFIHIYVQYSCTANEVIDFWYVIDFMINKYVYPDIDVNSEGRTELETLEEAIKIALNTIK